MLGAVLGLGACSGPCDQAREKAQACYDTVCAEGGEGHRLCDAPLPEITACEGTAQNAAQRLVDDDPSECRRVLNMYSNALSFQ